jgi:hypothetical protein
MARTDVHQHLWSPELLPQCPRTAPSPVPRWSTTSRFGCVAATAATMPRELQTWDAASLTGDLDDEAARLRRWLDRRHGGLCLPAAALPGLAPPQFRAARRPRRPGIGGPQRPARLLRHLLLRAARDRLDDDRLRQLAHGSDWPVVAFPPHAGPGLGDAAWLALSTTNPARLFAPEPDATP